jgi:predicted secreted hydrolase
MALALKLVATKPHVAHGDNGLDRKGSAPGNASYYYSVPRLAAEGSVTVGERTFAVTGSAWMDREWSTSSLEPGVVGWDWFALELSDGSSLMFYRLRTVDGGSSSYSSGSWIGADGSRMKLGVSDVTLTPIDHWTSPATGVRYPIAWRMSLEEPSLTLEVRPYLDEQEVDLSVRYWEGAVRGRGLGPRGPIEAQGYLELAGY